MQTNRTLRWSAILLLGYVVAILLAGPLLLKPLLVQQADKHLNGSLSLASVWINPFTLSLTLDKLELADRQGVLIGIESASVDIDILPLLILNVGIQDILLEGLTLHDRSASNMNLLTIGRVHVPNTQISLLTTSIDIDSIDVGKAVIQLIQKTDKSLNVDDFVAAAEALLPQQADEKRPAENPEETSPWLVIVNQFRLHQGNITFTDAAIDSGTHDNSIKLENIVLEANNIHSDLQQTLQFSLSMELLDGSFTLDGELAPDKLNGHVSYAFKALQLNKLNAFVSHYSLASMDSAILSSNGTVELFRENKVENKTETETADETENNKEQQILNISSKSQLSLSELKLSHQHFDDELLSCQELALKDIQILSSLDNKETALAIDNIAVNKCQINILLLPDGNNNLDVQKTVRQSGDNSSETSKTVLQAKQNEAPKPSPESSDSDTPDSFVFSIERILLEEILLTLTDQSQGEPIRLAMDISKASLEKLGNAGSEPSTISLDAMINEHAPLSIKGSAGLLNRESNTDLTLTLKRLGLKEFSPYTLKLGSRPVEKGVLSVDIKTSIQNREIESLNKLTIEGLKLGARQAQDGTGNLPLALAATVLKDSKGNIHIDIPVTGNLDDPSFSFRKQMLRTFTNLITKAAAAPLNLVGGIALNDGTRGRLIVFNENSSELTEETSKQIRQIAGTLEKNPELALSLKPLLSPNELGNTSGVDSLVTGRMQAIVNTLVDLAVANEQIEQKPLDESAQPTQGGVEIEFFAR